MFEIKIDYYIFFGFLHSENVPVREMCVDVVFCRVSFRYFRQQGFCVWNILSNFVFSLIYYRSLFAAFRFFAIYSHFPVVLMLRVENILFFSSWWNSLFFQILFTLTNVCVQFFYFLSNEALFHSFFPRHEKQRFFFCVFVYRKRSKTQSLSSFQNMHMFNESLNIMQQFIISVKHEEAYQRRSA